jgi:hypothetical protein
MKEKALARKRVSGKKVKRASEWWDLKGGESAANISGSSESHKDVINPYICNAS